MTKDDKISDGQNLSCDDIIIVWRHIKYQRTWFVSYQNLGWLKQYCYLVAYQHTWFVSYQNLGEL